MRPSGKRPACTDDRLSDLPDGLLHTIMSFLTARQAVQTCVLSRRWAGLWCSMPCLNIDEREFDASAVDEDDPEDVPCCARFENFVSNLLMFHTAPTLDRFRFHAVRRVTEFELLKQWIHHGMNLCPKVLEIHSKNVYFELPLPSSSSARLKRLHLVKVTLGRRFSRQLHSVCPMLEDLKLKECNFSSSEISSCTLKNLIIEDCITDEVLTVKAPFLTCLQLVMTASCWYWAGVVVNETPSLIKATICFKPYPTPTSYVLPELPCKLLCSLIYVRDLTLSGSKTLAILHEGLESDTFPVFHNLTTLMFNECDLSDNFELLGCFLNNAPILEKLTLHHCKLPEGSQKRKRRDNQRKIYLKRQDTLTFRCPNLKWTEINYKEDDVHQLFGLLQGIWRNLQKTTILLNKT